jgi:hypothetical protein
MPKMNVQFPVSIGLMLLMSSPPVCAQILPPHASPSPQSGPEVVRVDEGEAVRVLRTTVEDLTWEEVTFEYVIGWLRDFGEVNVVVDFDALRAVGVDADSTVTLVVRRATVAEVLNEVLDQLAGEEELHYRATGPWIRISTAEEFDRRLYVRVYNVVDLLTNPPHFTDAPQIDLSVAQQAGGSGAGTGQPVFTVTSGEDDQGENEDEIQRRLDDLASVIIDTIEPLSWDVYNGRGTIRTYNRMLIVRNSVEVHEQIAGAFRLGAFQFGD